MNRNEKIMKARLYSINCLLGTPTESYRYDKASDRYIPNAGNIHARYESDRVQLATMLAGSGVSTFGHNLPMSRQLDAMSSIIDILRLGKDTLSDYSATTSRTINGLATATLRKHGNVVAKSIPTNRPGLCRLHREGINTNTLVDLINYVRDNGTKLQISKL